MNGSSGTIAISCTASSGSHERYCYILSHITQRYDERCAETVTARNDKTLIGHPNGVLSGTMDHRADVVNDGFAIFNHSLERAADTVFEFEIGL
jgi:hypothetical protein